jgi:hypothetical protein
MASYALLSVKFDIVMAKNRRKKSLSQPGLIVSCDLAFEEPLNILKI